MPDPKSGPRSGSSRRPEVREFLRHLTDERQLSPHTVKAYARDLAELEAFVSDYVGRADWAWSAVDRLTIRGFLGWCRRKGLSRRSAARKLSAARVFFRFLHQEERIPTNPARAVRAPKIDRRLPGHLSAADVSVVFDVALNRAAENTLQATRDLVILELLYGSGLRLSELHGLDLAAVDRRCGTRSGHGEGQEGAHRAGDPIRASGTGSIRAEAPGGASRREAHAATPRPSW